MIGTTGRSVSRKFVRAARHDDYDDMSLLTMYLFFHYIFHFSLKKLPALFNFFLWFRFDFSWQFQEFSRVPLTRNQHKEVCGKWMQKMMVSLSHREVGVAQGNAGIGRCLFSYDGFMQDVKISEQNARRWHL